MLTMKDLFTGIKIMKKLTKSIILILVLIAVYCCKQSNLHELRGVKGREKWVEPTLYGMNYIHKGSFNLGVNDQDASNSNTMIKTVSIDAFWMDNTEITNNEYRQFVFWVRDSIARSLLSEQFPDFKISEDRKGNPIDPPYLNWNIKIKWDDPDYISSLSSLYVSENEYFYGKNEIDPRKLFYDYWWIDYNQAAQRSNSFNYETQKYEGMVTDLKGNQVPIESRASFIFRGRVNIYPDTLCWIRDFTYSYNEPFTKNYFSHVAFDDYPVVGVSWKQAKAFCHWRTKIENDFYAIRGEATLPDYRLPTETEWEFAARGDLKLSMYPWGSYYSREGNGIFLANFKPLRGDYIQDGSLTTIKVGSYKPNNFGLYDMAGNVAEWTNDAYDESGYIYYNDLNPSFEYNALPDDPQVMKRKVIRGGSWKDIASNIQVSARNFEYQDTAKSYIGFRCVRTSFCTDKYEDN
jgi:formylglycine-generating enzyme